MASGIVISLSYVIDFMAIKTYGDSETFLGLPGIAYLYAAFSLVAVLFIYFVLPETEKRSLEEIENHFRTKKWTDVKIERINEELMTIPETYKRKSSIDL